VNPLRKNFFVRADRTMQLRKLLDKLSNVEGMMGEEKDPEEFLRSLLEQTLKMEALIKLTSGQKTYFYQIFVEEDRNLILPSIQQLFEKSMFQMTLRFTQAPGGFRDQADAKWIVEV
jgi:ubiquitin thioesterase CYLD